MDELYALGVSACRWLTGEYPRIAEPTQDGHGTWRMDAVKVPEALLQVEPSPRSVVLRLLSVRPEERGTPAQLAEELCYVPDLPRSRSSTSDPPRKP